VKFYKQNLHTGLFSSACVNFVKTTAVKSVLYLMAYKYFVLFSTFWVQFQ